MVLYFFANDRAIFHPVYHVHQLMCNRPAALYRLMGKPHTGGKRPRIGFYISGKAHTGPLYGYLPSADIGQEGVNFAS